MNYGMWFKRIGFFFHLGDEIHEDQATVFTMH